VAAQQQEVTVLTQLLDAGAIDAVLVEGFNGPLDSVPGFVADMQKAISDQAVAQKYWDRELATGSIGACEYITLTRPSTSVRGVENMTAKAKMEALNPDVNVVTYHTRVDSSNIMEIIRDYDFIIDGTDNFPTKFLINDACVMAGKPFSHGGILRFDGQTMTYLPGSGCYRCVFPTPPPKGAVPTCSEAGILGAVAGMLGTVQAAEALRYLIGKGRLLNNRLLIFNALNMEYRTLSFKPNPTCPVCGAHPTITELIDYEQPACDLRSRNHD
jgi:hypothetical protein